MKDSKMSESQLSAEQVAQDVAAKHRLPIGASEHMLSFTKKAQARPEKRAADVRARDHSEIYGDYSLEAAEEQSSRCSQCGIPFCQVHCPLGNNIPDWLRLTAEGRLEEAYEISSATNNMPEICGRICPQDRLCEGNCVIETGFDSVTIGSVEKHITDTAFENGWVKPVVPARERSESVGIIGAGPAGMAAAEELRKYGYSVTIYDRYDRAGGLLIYGIPGFKLEKEIVERRTKLLIDSGVTFKLGVNIGEDITFAELRARHHAVLIATGVYKPRALALPGTAGLGGVAKALDYLTASNRITLGDDVPAFTDGTLNARGKNVVVIGGGDTAMDCVRTAIRQEAKSVTCLYRRDRANMPGSAREVAHAEEEGVKFVWLSAPEALHGDSSVTAVQAYKMRLSAAGTDGRQKPVAIPDSSFKLECDLAIEALGFEPEDLPTLFDAPDLPVTRWGTVLVDHKFETRADGVFAAGDIVRGASLVVWAVKEGRDASAAIHAYIQQRVAKVA